MTQEEMVKYLTSKDLSKVKGGKGSHVKVTEPGLRRPIIIPKGELKKGTERSILKEAGLL